MGNVGIEIDKIYFGIEQHRTRKESSKSVQIYIKYGDMQYKEKIRKFLLNFDTGEQITLDENDKLFRAKSKDGKVIE